MNMTSQTAHTKRKWPPYATEWKPLPWKFSAYATGSISPGNCNGTSMKRNCYWKDLSYLPGVVR